MLDAHLLFYSYHQYKVDNSHDSVGIIIIVSVLGSLVQELLAENFSAFEIIHQGIQ
jgi:hypothetical protein